MTEKRVAIVTGGSRGIGAAIVRQLVADGLHVVAVARSLDKLQAIADESNGAVEPLVCDIADSKGLAAAIDGVGEKHGRLDVLVNNAGITKDGLLLRMSDEDYDLVLDTNLKSAFVAIRSAARLIMRSKTGRIVNISSVSGVAGNAGQANYSASKAGLIGLSKTVAKELAGKGRDVQRGRAGVHHDRHDRRAARQDQRGGQGDDPAQAVWGSKGDRRGRVVPGVGGGVVRDGSGAVRGRRHGDVMVGVGSGSLVAGGWRAVSARRGVDLRRAPRTTHHLPPTTCGHPGRLQRSPPRL